MFNSYIWSTFMQFFSEIFITTEVIAFRIILIQLLKRWSHFSSNDDFEYNAHKIFKTSEYFLMKFLNIYLILKFPFKFSKKIFLKRSYCWSFKNFASDRYIFFNQKYKNILTLNFFRFKIIITFGSIISPQNFLSNCWNNFLLPRVIYYAVFLIFKCLTFWSPL